MRAKRARERRDDAREIAEIVQAEERLGCND